MRLLIAFFAIPIVTVRSQIKGTRNSFPSLIANHSQLARKKIEDAIE